MDAPISTELRATQITLLAGVTETRAAKWEGLVEVLSIAFNPRWNWRVEVGGAAGDQEVIDKAVELLRDAHPYVSAERSPGG